jgi:membrane associated rhomboid family serine protease
MPEAAALRIRSQHGLLRDLFPAYEWQRTTMLAAGICVAIWLLWLVDWRHPVPILLPLALGWISLFQMRPSAMLLTCAQAAQVEATMLEEGHYSASDDGAGWRLDREPGNGQSREALEFRAVGDGVELLGPREWLEAVRNHVEWVAEGGVPLGNRADQPFQTHDPDPVPWHAHVPGALIGAIIVPLFLYEMGTGRIAQWGLSGTALAAGRYETIFLHMFEHGSVMHILMNGAALAAIGGRLANRLGEAPFNSLRFLLLFLMSGLAAAMLFVALHPFGQVPMVGASGALYGLVGLLIRLPASGEALLSLRSARIRRIGWSLVRENIFLFALLALMAWESGSAGGLAWEAHLGGFLFGFFIGPKFLPRTTPRRVSQV